MHIYIPKCNPLSLCNVTSPYAFRADHLLLGNQFMSSSHTRVSLTLRIPQLPVLLDVGLRSHGLPHPLCCRLTGVVRVHVYLGSHVAKALWVVSDITGRPNLTANFPILRLLQSLLSFF